MGAVGGVRHLNLGKENPLLSLDKSPAKELKETNGREEKSSPASSSIVDTAVIEISGSGEWPNGREQRTSGSGQGIDNSGFVVDGEGEESDEEGEELCYADDVVFMEGGAKKEEKKTNGVI